MEKRSCCKATAPFFGVVRLAAHVSNGCKSLARRAVGRVQPMARASS